MMVRHCPHCDQEFQAHVTTCSDCGRPLPEPRPEGIAPSAPSAPAARADEPAGEEDGLSVAGGLEPARAAEAGRLLTEAGIVPRMRNKSGRPSISVEVQARDFEAAAALLEKAGLREPVDLADPVALTGGPCPACGTQVTPGVVDCPECGLALGDAPLVCSRCGAELEGPFACPKCEPD